MPSGHHYGQRPTNDATEVGDMITPGSSHDEAAGPTHTASVLTAGAVLAVALGGYAGFRLAAQLDLGSQVGLGLVALAVVTGFAAFFSPCSFPLLLGLLAGSDAATTNGRSRSEGIRTALAMGLGAAAFLLLVGAVVGLIGEGVVRSVGFSTTPGRILRATVAAVVILAGTTQLGLTRAPFWRVTSLAQPIDRLRVVTSENHRRLAQSVYGFGFVVAGFG